jgi:ketosteroid isomerase-like protein
LTSSLSTIATNWFAAFNRHDLEGLLQLYHDQAEHYSPKLKLRHPETKGLIKGKVALREWWADSFRRLPTLRYEVIKLTIGENCVFIEYTRHVKGEEDLRVGEILEVKEGVIVASRVYHS